MAGAWWASLRARLVGGRAAQGGEDDGDDGGGAAVGAMHTALAVQLERLCEVLGVEGPAPGRAWEVVCEWEGVRVRASLVAGADAAVAGVSEEDGPTLAVWVGEEGQAAGGEGVVRLRWRAVSDGAMSDGSPESEVGTGDEGFDCVFGAEGDALVVRGVLSDAARAALLGARVERYRVDRWEARGALVGMVWVNRARAPSHFNALDIRRALRALRAQAAMLDEAHEAWRARLLDAAVAIEGAPGLLAARTVFGCAEAAPELAEALREAARHMPSSQRRRVELAEALERAEALHTSRRLEVFHYWLPLAAQEQALATAALLQLHEEAPDDPRTREALLELLEATRALPRGQGWSWQALGARLWLREHLPRAEDREAALEVMDALMDQVMRGREGLAQAVASIFEGVEATTLAREVLRRALAQPRGALATHLLMREQVARFPQAPETEALLGRLATTDDRSAAWIRLRAWCLETLRRDHPRSEATMEALAYAVRHEARGEVVAACAQALAAGVREAPEAVIRRAYLAACLRHGLEHPLVLDAAAWAVFREADAVNARRAMRVVLGAASGRAADLIAGLSEAHHPAPGELVWRMLDAVIRADSRQGLFVSTVHVKHIAVTRPLVDDDR